MISCGEPSGDLYAGALVAALRRREPDLEVFGLGGERLKAAGAELVADFHGLSVTGLTEALAVLPRSWRMLRLLTEAARTRKPDALVVIDYPDFNFRLMRAIKGLGVPVIYYVSPQLWAWRAGRMKTMKRFVDRVLPIFPFEEALYQQAGVAVRFVGHPLIELIAPVPSREALIQRWNLDPALPVVALLPGSRINELERLAPVMAAALPMIVARVPEAQFVVAQAPNLSNHLFEGFGIPGVTLRASDTVITASGTATVQTALHDKPMVVLYKLSPMTYRLGRRLALVDTYAMVNLIAGQRVVRELIQDDCTPEAVAAETIRLLTDRAYRQQMVNELAEVRRRLGGAGASERAAEAVLDVVHSAHAP